MKFKSGDVLKDMYTGDIRTVTAVLSDKEQYSVIGERRGPYQYLLSRQYVEFHYEIKDLLESPLYKALS